LSRNNNNKTNLLHPTGDLTYFSLPAETNVTDDQLDAMLESGETNVFIKNVSTRTSHLAVDQSR